MRVSQRALLTATALLLGGFVVLSAAQDANDSSAEQDKSRPELSVRPLPADTFQPSEEISEDVPVPFPVDI